MTFYYERPIEIDKDDLGDLKSAIDDWKIDLELGNEDTAKLH